VNSYFLIRYYFRQGNACNVFEKLQFFIPSGVDILVTQQEQALGERFPVNNVSSCAIGNHRLLNWGGGQKTF